LRHTVGDELGADKRTMGVETCVRPTALLHAVTLPSSTAEYLRFYELGINFNNIRTRSWFCQTTQVDELQVIERSCAWKVRFLGGFPCYRTADMLRARFPGLFRAP